MNYKERFRKLSSEHNKATNSGDDIVANKLHSELTSLYDIIKENEYWSDMIEMNFDSDEGVRLWAAPLSP